MRYRQWKKNYKKRHGHNPGIILDRRLWRRKFNAVRRGLTMSTRRIRKVMKHSSWVIQNATSRFDDLTK